MKKVDLARRRILVVEDDYFLAADIVAQIEHNNGIPVGPAMTLEKGLDVLRTEKPDACILDIRLGPELAYELADKLLADGIPFVFASGELRASIPGRFAKVPLHTKPIEMIWAAATLMGTEGSQSSG